MGDVRGILVVICGFATVLFSFFVAFYTAKYVKRDREKIQTSIGHPGELTLGPWRWALITFFSGGLGLGLYWFVTYQNAFVELLKQRKNGS